MISSKNLKIIFILLISSIFLNSCGGKLPGADARKYDPDPKKRVAKNLEEGRGFRLMESMGKNSTDQTSNESIKISIRFLTNEIRSDALDIKVFNKKCLSQLNCVISEKSGNLITELREKILKTAALYGVQKNTKNSKKYKGKQKY